MKYFLLFFLIFSKAYADNFYLVVVKKQEKKMQSRWTLASWLETKNRMALMDQWLALNTTDTWLEVILDYSRGEFDQTLNEVDQDTKIKFNRHQLSIYLKFIGFEYDYYDYSDIKKESVIKLNLLLLGSSVQSTSVRFFAGSRSFTYEGYSKYSQLVHGASVSFYFLDFFGTELEYTKYNKTKSQDKLYSLDGEKLEYGAFLEISALRLYLNKYKEKNYFSGSPNLNRRDEGYSFGLKLFL